MGEKDKINLAQQRITKNCNKELLRVQIHNSQLRTNKIEQKIVSNLIQKRVSYISLS